MGHEGGKTEGLHSCEDEGKWIEEENNSTTTDRGPCTNMVPELTTDCTQNGAGT